MSKFKNKKKDFASYMKELNSYNENITINNNIYPQISNKLYSIYNDLYKELVYKNIFNRLLNLLYIMYKWKTPDYISRRVIETGYIFRGAVAFFKDQEIKNNIAIEKATYCLPAVTSNIYNIYGDPTQVRVEGYNGYNKNIDVVYAENIPVNFDNFKNKSEGYGVFSRDNDTQYPYIFYVEEYASKLADSIVAKSIATQHLKKPFVFYGLEPYIKENAEDLVEKFVENKPTILILKNDDSMLENKNGKPFEAINITQGGDSVKAIEDSINFDLNMFLETIGINTNPSPDKSQVVLTSEINSNNLLIDLEQDVRLTQRKKFCEDIKKIFNIELSVEINLPEIKKEVKKIKKDIGAEGGTEKNTKKNK